MLSELRRRQRDPGVLARIDQLLRLHRERLLAVDLAVAPRWGQLSAALGHDSADLLIAATALEHGLTVVTRNLRHVLPTGVASLNPWQGLGEG
ncbi:MAG: PIN domain-containing protein [Cyanobacteriota bacterium]